MSNGKLISILILSIAKHTLTELLHKELDFIIGYYLRDFRQIHYLSSEKISYERLGSLELLNGTFWSNFLTFISILTFMVPR